MTLHLIGIGLHDEKDITLRGLETVKRCSEVYLEDYTAVLQCPLKKLEDLYGKKVILANRELVEKKADKILEKASVSDVAFLVVGDPMGATTHIDLILRAKSKGIAVSMAHNASMKCRVPGTTRQCIGPPKSALIRSFALPTMIC